MQCRGQYHLPTAHHTPPPTVRGEGGPTNLREVSSVGHPRDGVIVLHECQDVRRGTFYCRVGGVSCGRREGGRRRGERERLVSKLSILLSFTKIIIIY